MNILAVLGHPRPGSFNHAIAGAVCDNNIKQKGNPP